MYVVKGYDNMEKKSELLKDPNMLVAQKSTKEKLKEMYAKHLGKSKDQDMIRKLYSANLDIQNIAGSIALTIFAPEFTWVIPLGKYAKSIRLKAYDGAKSVVDKIAGVEIEQNDSEEEKIELSDSEREAIIDGARGIFDKIINKDTSIQTENIINQKGKTR